ncbi:MAG: hypothetical protein JXR68_13055 [Bacteroidales bacterium]|nr:hypothetical protein [Bacteroidales bacterium]
MTVQYINNDYVAGIDRDNDIFYYGNGFLKLPEKQQKFIIWHEVGHRNLSTDCEFEADEYAINHYANSERYSLKSIYDAIQTIPDYGLNILRKKTAIQKILEIDCFENNNQKACNMLYSYPNTNNFLGLCPLREPERSECQKKKEEEKAIKKEERQQSRDARKDNRQTKNEAWTSILELMAFGNPNTSKDKTQTNNNSLGSSVATNKTPLIIIGIVVLLLIIFLIFILKR